MRCLACGERMRRIPGSFLGFVCRCGFMELKPCDKLRERASYRKGRPIVFPPSRWGWEHGNMAWSEAPMGMLAIYGEVLP